MQAWSSVMKPVVVALLALISTWLRSFNAANAASGRTGGFFELEQVAAVDPGVALDRLGGREFVFDVQGHFVGQHGLGQTGLGGAEQFIKDIFLDSDTDMMVLSFIPSRREKEWDVRFSPSFGHSCANVRLPADLA